VSFTLFSGMAPLAATTLIRETGTVVSPAYLMMGSALLALVGSFWVDGYGGSVLRTDQGDHVRSPMTATS
jgi:hypothetical protein